MLSTVFFNQSLNSTLIEALMVSTSNYEMRGSLFLGIDASFNLKFRIAPILVFNRMASLALMFQDWEDSSPEAVNLALLYPMPS